MEEVLKNIFYLRIDISGYISGVPPPSSTLWDSRDIDFSFGAEILNFGAEIEDFRSESGSDFKGCKYSR